MPTSKSTKKARKKSAKKKEEPEGRKKGGGRKTSGKKAGSKKSAASGKSDKKAAAKGSKAAAAKGSPRNRAAQKATGRATKSRAGTAAFVGTCLGLVEAGAIVEHAVRSVGGISSADYDIDKKMEQMGVITANHCTLVKQMILNDVRSFPCDINDGAISIDPSTVARAVRDQVKDNSARPS